MKRLRWIGLLIACAVLAGCAKDDECKVAFHAEISDIGAFSAVATVTHNATNRDPYYGIVVEGSVPDVSAAIAQYISEQREFLEVNKHYQRKNVFKITRLSPEKIYTFIVFGMKDDMQVYGEPDVVVFSTTRSNLEAMEFSNWHIQYKGHVVYDKTDYSLITVYVDEDTIERYFLASLPLREAQKYETTEDLIVQATYDFLDKQKKQSEEDYFLEASEVRTGGTNFYRYLSPGNYVFYAIGINPDGSPTGHYAKSPECAVEKYPYEQTYADLLGDWVISGNGKDYYVTFSERTLNKTLYMTGWGNYPDYTIVLTYNREDGGLEIKSQLVAKDVTIKFSGEESPLSGTLYLMGAYYNSEGKLKNTEESLTLAKAKLESDGTYTFKSGFYVTMSDGKANYNTGMMYYLKGEEKNVLFARLMFPFVMEKQIKWL